MSSIQSVPGQPEAAPLPSPRHQIAAAPSLLAAAWLVRSAQVAGGADE